MQPSLITVIADHLMANSDYTVLVDATTGTVNISLPANDQTTRGRIYVIKKIDITNNLVWVMPDGTDVIDGATSFFINTTNESVTIQADGRGNWRIL